MDSKASNNLNKSLLIIGCGAVPLTAILFQATPVLIITVALPLLTLFTTLLLLLVLIALVTGLLIGIGWYGQWLQMIAVCATIGERDVG